ncbi:MAG TPA: hypothetical protein VKY85_11780 [Candidatus Angelobacter sp.]|nr:hypothetical protein [Candidatus Angelobacter sp.]
MKNFWISVIVVGGLTVAGGAQTAATESASPGTSPSIEKKSARAGLANTAVANGSGLALANGTTLQAELSKSLDTKKAKVSDIVTAKATQDVQFNGRVVIGKGSKLIGHVTEAQVRTTDSTESRLGIVFDHAVLKDGSEVTLNAVVQAVIAAPTVPVSFVTNDAASASGGLDGSAGGIANGDAANGTLNSALRGVLGLKGLTLNSSASGLQGSVISSTTQNVKLDSGTRMILRVRAPAQQ